MIDAFDRLFDNRSFVQIGRDIVRRRPDQLYAAFIRLMIRFRAFKAGQKRMVDIDAVSRQRAAHVVGQNLHITGKNDQINVQFVL